MVLARSAQFQLKQAETHVEPVVTINAPAFNGAVRCGQPEAVTNQVICGAGFGFPDFFASRAVRFSGRVVCGQSLAITGTLKCGGRFDQTADTRLVRLDQGGIGDKNASFNQGLISNVGNTSFSLVNGDLVVGEIIGRSLIENTRVDIAIGFLEGSLFDYLTVFSGVIDQVDDISLRRARFNLLDGSFRRHLEIPETLGGDVFPGTAPNSVGKAVQIVVGNVASAVSLEVEGSASSLLALSLNSVDTDCFLEVSDSSTFARNGEITIDPGGPNEETLRYGQRENVLAEGRETIHLLLLTRPNGVAHGAGELVVSTNERFTHLLGHEVRSLGLVRDENGTARFDGGVTFAAPGASLAVSTVNFATEVNPAQQVDLDGLNLQSSLVVNGEDATSAAGWITTNAVVTAELHDPSGTFRYLKVQPDFENVAGIIHQDIEVTQNDRYVLVLYYDGETGASISIRAGTPVSPTAYVGLEDAPIQPNRWERRLFVVTATAGTVLRITLRVAGATGAPAGFFRAIRLRPAIDDNPAHVIRYLANTFMPAVRLDEDNLNALEAARADYRLAGVVDFPVNSRTLFEQIAEQINCLYFESPRGLAKFVPNRLDDPEDFTMDTSQSRRAVTRYQRVRASENIFTDFEVYYDRNPSLGTASSAYRGFLFARPDGSNHSQIDLTPRCQAALGISGTRRTKRVLGYLIADRDTAEAMLLELIELHTVRTYDLFMTAFLNAVHLEQGDVIKAIDPSLAPGVNEATFRILDTRLSFSTMQTAFRARMMARGPLGIVRVLIFQEDFEPTTYGRVPLFEEDFEATQYNRVALFTEDFEVTQYNRTSNYVEPFEVTQYNRSSNYQEPFEPTQYNRTSNYTEPFES